MSKNEEENIVGVWYYGNENMSTSSSSSSLIGKLINATQQPHRKPRLSDEEKQKIFKHYYPKKVIQYQERPSMKCLNNLLLKENHRKVMEQSIMK